MRTKFFFFFYDFTSTFVNGAHFAMHYRIKEYLYMFYCLSLGSLSFLRIVLPLTIFFSSDIVF